MLNDFPHDEQNLAVRFCRDVPHWEQNSADKPEYGGGALLSGRPKNDIDSLAPGFI